MLQVWLEELVLLVLLVRKVKLVRKEVLASKDELAILVHVELRVVRVLQAPKVYKAVLDQKETE